MSRDPRAPGEWNAAKYHSVSDPQFNWGKTVLDRLGRLPLRGDEVIVDAGCGTGRLTAELLERWPAARVVAVDASQNMLEVARRFLERFGSRVSFVCADLAAWHDDACADVVFSTATFHWIKDHPKLFANLFRALRPGGWLCGQCGGASNLAVQHARCDELIRREPFAPFFTEWTDPWEFASADTTRLRLAAAGFVGVETSVELADVVFPGPGEFREFVTTVILRPYLAYLPEEALRAKFVERITDLAAHDSPAYCLDYRRLNLLGHKPR
jgi:trans-aconitate methyltransferase